MTILTKPSLAKPLNKGDATLENGPIIEQDENGNDDRLFILHERRRFTGSTVLLLLATLCLACMGFLIGLVVYRRVQMQQMHFRGMCNLPYDEDFEENKEILNYMNSRFQDMENSALKLQDLFDSVKDEDGKDFFREEFDLSVDNDNEYSKINVPDFRDGRIGRFLHDFKSNQTAIIDESTQRCFVMPLDREAILPPKSLYDIIGKMYKGYYDINTTSIRKNMRVVTPALDDLSLISPNIQSACDSMSIYRLEKFVSGVVKRSAELTADGKFSEFAGNFVHYNIINIDHLNRK